MYMTPFNLLSSGLLYGFRSSLCLWVDSSEFCTFSMSKKLSNNNMNVCVAAEPGILQNVMTPVLLQTFKWYSGFRVSGLDCLLHTSITHDVIIKLELPRLTCYWSSPELCGFNTDHVSDCSVQWTIGTRNPKPLYQWIINYLQWNYIYIQTHYKIV